MSDPFLYSRDLADLPERKFIYDELVKMSVEPAVLKIGGECIAGIWERIGELSMTNTILRGEKVGIVVLAKAGTWEAVWCILKTKWPALNMLREKRLAAGNVMSTSPSVKAKAAKTNGSGSTKRLPAL